jgi:hypothetical protein
MGTISGTGTAYPSGACEHSRGFKMLFVLQFWFSGVMVLNAIFNNILVISWRLVFCVQYLLNVFDHGFMSFCHSFVVFIYSHGF